MLCPFQKQVLTAHDSDDDHVDAVALGADVGSENDDPVENSRTSGRSKAKGKKKSSNANGSSKFIFFYFTKAFSSNVENVSGCTIVTPFNKILYNLNQDFMLQ